MLPKLLQDLEKRRLEKQLPLFKKAVVKELQQNTMNDLGCPQRKMGDFQEDAQKLQTLELTYPLPKTKKTALLLFCLSNMTCMPLTQILCYGLNCEFPPNDIVAKLPNPHVIRPGMALSCQTTQAELPLWGTCWEQGMALSTLHLISLSLILLSTGYCNLQATQRDLEKLLSPRAPGLSLGQNHESQC